MNHFQGRDFYLLNELNNEENRMVQNTVREFIDRDYLPIIKEHFRAGTFPLDLIPALGELGVFGAHIKGYGCPGLSMKSYGLMMQELERADSGLRSFATVQGSLAMTAIYKFGSEQQKEQWLPRMASGEVIGCFGLTEPDYGSNPAGMKTHARKEGSEYVLNGTKTWITNGSIADVAVIWAKTEPDNPRSIRGFLVEKGTPGFTSSDIKGKVSMRASITSELNLDGCRIPESNLLPLSRGLRSPLTCLDYARYGISWGAIGAAMACFEEVLEYARTRVQFKGPIGGYQLVQEKLVRMFTDITKAQCLVNRLADLMEEDRARAEQISMAKMNNVRMALEVARTSRDILGANGIVDDYQTIRHMVNLESLITYEGTHHVHVLILGHHLTGIPAFS